MLCARVCTDLNHFITLLAWPVLAGNLSERRLPFGKKGSAQHVSMQVFFPPQLPQVSLRFSPWAVRLLPSGARAAVGPSRRNDSRPILVLGNAWIRYTQLGYKNQR